MDEMALQDSREMNYDSKLQNMSWFCYIHVNTLSKTSMATRSLTTKYYRVQVGNHHRGYRSPCISLALKKELILLEQFNQWLGVLGIHIEWRLQVSEPQNTSHICMIDLGWFQRKQHCLSRIHGGNLHQMHMNWRKSLLTSEHMLHELAWANAFKIFQH